MHPRDIFTKTYKATNIKIKNMACFRKHIKGCDTAWQNIYCKPVSKLIRS